jgi:hypothetical protein
VQNNGSLQVTCSRQGIHVCARHDETHVVLLLRLKDRLDPGTGISESSLKFTES